MPPRRPPVSGSARGRTTMVKLPSAGTTTATSTPWSRLPLLAPRLAPASGSGQAGANPWRQRRGHWRSRRGRPRPQLVCGLPVRPEEGRTHPYQRRHGWVSASDVDGWREVLHQQQTRPATTSVVSRTDHSQHQQPRKIPVKLFGRCFNYLSSTHRLATCRLPRRCLRCHGLHHLARDCRRPRHVAAPQRMSHDSTRVEGACCWKPKFGFGNYDIKLLMPCV